MLAFENFSLKLRIPISRPDFLAMCLLPNSPVVLSSLSTGFQQLHKCVFRRAVCAHLPSQWACPALEWCLLAFSRWPLGTFPASHCRSFHSQGSSGVAGDPVLSPPDPACFASSSSSRKTEWSLLFQVLSRVMWCSNIMTTEPPWSKTLLCLFKF